MFLFLLKFRFLLSLIAIITQLLGTTAEAGDTEVREECAPFLHVSCGLPIERPDSSEANTLFPVTGGWKRVRSGPRVGIGYQTDDRQTVAGVGGGVFADEAGAGWFLQLKF